MKFSFPEKNPETVKNKIMAELGGRELGKMVNFGVEANQLTVTISKLGTSVLTFAQTTTATGLEYCLATEKIALAHRAFKDDVKTKLCNIIEKVGGKVLET
jgi:hypothetical protein